MPLKYKHTILLVDDEVSITNSLQRLFRRDGYHILSAASGEQGLDVIKNHGKSVSLIISDQRMPVMTGAQFLEKAKELAPDAVRFLLTGYSDMDAMMDAVNKGEIHRYFNKPWNDSDLLLQVKTALEQYELVLENRKLTRLARKQNKALRALAGDLEKKVEERSKEILIKNRELSALNKELETGLFNTVRAFASLAELHAPLLAGHGKRVSYVSREIALCMKLSENETTHVEIAALLHDIGKLGLSENLLAYRRDKWNAEEKAAYLKHPEESQIVVRFIKSLDHVGLLIRSHHERYDGQGFPDRLSEETIPLGSRIIAVADVYDRIVNLKIDNKEAVEEYLKDTDATKEYFQEDELIERAAIQHLKLRAFTHYDPDVVRTFLDFLKTKGVRYDSERQMPIESLKPGMVLTRSIYTKSGKFLLPQNTTLTEDYIKKLIIISQNRPIPDVYIIRG